jgi:hypothetical protein
MVKFMQKIKIDKFGNKEYYWNGELHREDGPAVECANGDKEWWIRHIQYSEENYWRVVKLKVLW